MRVHVDFVLLCVKHHFQFHGWTEGSVQQRRLSPDTKDGEHYDEGGLNDNTQPFKSRFLSPPPPPLTTDRHRKPAKKKVEGNNDETHSIGVQI